MDPLTVEILAVRHNLTVADAHRDCTVPGGVHPSPAFPPGGGMLAEFDDLPTTFEGRWEALPERVTVLVPYLTEEICHAVALATMHWEVYVQRAAPLLNELLLPDPLMQASMMMRSMGFTIPFELPDVDRAAGWV